MHTMVRCVHHSHHHPHRTALCLCCTGRSLWQLLMQHWGPPVPPLPDASELEAVRAAATAANRASRVHQADLASRAVLNAALEHVHKVCVIDSSIHCYTCSSSTVQCRASCLPEQSWTKFVCANADYAQRGISDNWMHMPAISTSVCM